MGQEKQQKLWLAGNHSVKRIPSPKLVPPPPQVVPCFCFHHDSSTEEKKMLAKEYVSIPLGKHHSHFWLMNCILAYTLQYQELGWWACCPREKDLWLPGLKRSALEWDIQREALENLASVVADTSLGAMVTQGTSIRTQGISTSIQEWRAPWEGRSIAQCGDPGLRPG